MAKDRRGALTAETPPGADCSFCWRPWLWRHRRVDLTRYRLLDLTERPSVALRRRRGVDRLRIIDGDFIVHPGGQRRRRRGVLGLENLANLSALPPSGATMIALPMKIENGSGGPVRAIALIPR